MARGAADGEDGDPFAEVPLEELGGGSGSGGAGAQESGARDEDGRGNLLGLGYNDCDDAEADADADIDDAENDDDDEDEDDDDEDGDVELDHHHDHGENEGLQDAGARAANVGNDAQRRGWEKGKAFGARNNNNEEARAREKTATRTTTSASASSSTRSAANAGSDPRKSCQLSNQFVKGGRRLKETATAAQPHEVNPIIGSSTGFVKQFLSSANISADVNMYIPDFVKTYAAGGEAARTDAQSRERVLTVTLERLGGMRVAVLGYESGFQVWRLGSDGEPARELTSLRHGGVRLCHCLAEPRHPSKFESVQPLLALVPTMNRDRKLGAAADVVRIFSVRKQKIVHKLPMQDRVVAMQSSDRFFAVAMQAKIAVFKTTTFEEHVIFDVTAPPPGVETSLALGHRWIAYIGPMDAAFPDDTHVDKDVTAAPAGKSGTHAAQNSAGAATKPAAPASRSGGLGESSGPWLPTGTNSRESGPNWSSSVKGAAKELASGLYYLGDLGLRKIDERRNGASSDADKKTEAREREARQVRIDLAVARYSRAGVIVRDLVTNTIISAFKSHSRPAGKLCFDPTGSLLVVCSLDGQAINVHKVLPQRAGVGSTPSHRLLYRLSRGITNAVIRDVSFSENLRWLAVTSARGTTHMYAICPSGGSPSTLTHRTVNHAAAALAVKMHAHSKTSGNSSADRHAGTCLLQQYKLIPAPSEKDHKDLDLKAVAASTWDICRRDHWRTFIKPAALPTPRAQRHSGVNPALASQASPGPVDSEGRQAERQRLLWLSNVEIFTSAAPLTHIWTAPQFQFATYNQDAALSSIAKLFIEHATSTTVQVRGAGPMPTFAPSPTNASDRSKTLDRSSSSGSHSKTSKQGKGTGNNNGRSHSKASKSKISGSHASSASNNHGINSGGGNNNSNSNNHNNNDSTSAGDHGGMYGAFDTVNNNKSSSTSPAIPVMRGLRTAINTPAEFQDLYIADEQELDDHILVFDDDMNQGDQDNAAGTLEEGSDPLSDDNKNDTYASQLRKESAVHEEDTTFPPEEADEPLLHFVEDEDGFMLGSCGEMSDFPRPKQE
ncbi:Breast carcinoma-amplified sequence 3 [Hondaea fermentalgiana]|uniref:Breast carcinoma-amplified sequence 3 n=1 Tax=Hondaea fermentalgiana TaxID=2315210 RepID=A0A2R5GHQ7_9STRA|nr:Breast carcinoma-amplified sequence 3 [Hondaea fermentalgiana]|eukprot:GBG27821.1 Breast carcinoma-amplified sequence 3 [Hondaea fermentalgiana]